MILHEFGLIFHVRSAPLTCQLRVLQANIVVIAFSEPVRNFGVSDIDITGGRISDFLGNGKEFRVTIQTPTTAEIYVPAKVCESLMGEPNLVSNRLVYHA